MKYDEITLEQIDFISNTDVICDGDKKEVTLVERGDDLSIK